MTKDQFPLPRGRGGFSLVELLIVLVLLAILVAVMAPSLNGMLSRARTREAAGQLTADLAYARMLALRSGLGTWVAFDAPAVYRVVERVGPQPGDTAVRKRVDLRADHGAVTLDRPGGAVRAIFNTRGMVAAGAGTYLISPPAGASTPADTVELRILGNVERKR